MILFLAAIRIHNTKTATVKLYRYRPPTARGTSKRNLSISLPQMNPLISVASDLWRPSQEGPCWRQAPATAGSPLRIPGEVTTWMPTGILQVRLLEQEVVFCLDHRWVRHGHLICQDFSFTRFAFLIKEYKYYLRIDSSN